MKTKNPGFNNEFYGQYIEEKNFKLDKYINKKVKSIKILLLDVKMKDIITEIETNEKWENENSIFKPKLIKFYEYFEKKNNLFTENDPRNKCNNYNIIILNKDEDSKYFLKVKKKDNNFSFYNYLFSIEEFKKFNIKNFDFIFSAKEINDNINLLKEKVADSRLNLGKGYNILFSNMR